MRFHPQIDDTRLPTRKPNFGKQWRGESMPKNLAQVPDLSEDEIERRFQLALSRIKRRRLEQSADGSEQAANR